MPGAIIAVEKRAMTAMQLTCPDLSTPTPQASIAAARQDRQRPTTALGDAPATAPFQPLDPGVVSDAIPAFFIGRNRQGFWLARDVKGETGGIFLFKSSAVSFARTNSQPLGCATIFLSERFELDLENRGNPLLPQLASWIGQARRPWRRSAALIGHMTAAIKRRAGFLT
jgi:hypothetical protein